MQNVRLGSANALPKRTLSLVSLIEYSGLDLFVCV